MLDEYAKKYKLEKQDWRPEKPWYRSRSWATGVCRDRVESWLGGHADSFCEGTSGNLVSNWIGLWDWQLGVFLVC